ncbi:MAG TPA: hypothetical protein DEP46_04330 [Blastocatellia bacterium]|nr:hypothetical protein [Blastocatellia bacterium]
MTNAQSFVPGDFLVFQLESGYGLMRLLAIGAQAGEAVWHVRGYSDLFFDTENAEERALNGVLGVAVRHVALTERAFESTQVSRLAHRDLEPELLALVKAWENDPERVVSDRSVRLHLGLR